MERTTESEYLSGSVNLIKSLEIDKRRSLIIVSSETQVEFAEYLLEAARSESIDNVLFVVLPGIFRPITKIPDSLDAAVRKAGALIYSVNRLPEENFTFNRPLQALCISNRCKYLYLYDPKLDYLVEGIAADYQTVNKKAKKIKRILENSEQVRVTSELGTNLSFSLYTHNIVPRSPLFDQGIYWNQAPEGEVMSCPLEKSFNGTLVVDGVVTGVGMPPSHVHWEFIDGVVSSVRGDAKFLSELLNMLKKSDERLESLEGMSIAEMSVGCNDWAIFDDNISNCEKVSGSIHFAMGNSEGLGEDRGETYHFDNILRRPTVIVRTKTDEQVVMVQKGKLLI